MQLWEGRQSPKQEVKCVSNKPLSPHEGDGLEDGKARGITTAPIRGGIVCGRLETKGKRWESLKKHLEDS